MYFALQSSPILKRVAITSHGLSLILLWLTHWHFTVRLLLSLLVLLSLFKNITLSQRQRYTGFTLEPDQTITLIAPPDTALNGRLTSGTYVTPLLVLLRIEISQHKFPITLVIFYDALSSDLFRELRIRLKYAP